MQINITSNVKQVEKQLTALERKVLPRATNKTLNRVGGKLNTQVVRYVSKKVGLPQKNLRQRGFFARVTSNLRTMTTHVRVMYGALPLKDFKATQTPKGVTATSWGKKKLYKNTFISNELYGHVFVRKTKKRLPISKVYGANPAEVAKSSELRLILTKVIEENMGKEMTSNIHFFANKELKKMQTGVAGGHAKVL